MRLRVLRDYALLPLMALGSLDPFRSHVKGLRATTPFGARYHKNYSRPMSEPHSQHSRAQLRYCGAERHKLAAAERCGVPDTAAPPGAAGECVIAAFISGRGWCAAPARAMRLPPPGYAVGTGLPNG